MRHIEDNVTKWMAAALRQDERTLGDFIFYHPPNGMETKPSVAVRMKEMGMRPGVTDFVISFEYVTGYIEVKSAKGTFNDNQKVFRADCQRIGLPYWSVKTDNPIEAQKQIREILKRLREINRERKEKCKNH